MCMSRGAPKKPEFGPCRETHGVGGIRHYYNNVNYGTSTAADITVGATDFGTIAGNTFTIDTNATGVWVSP